MDNANPREITSFDDEPATPVVGLSPADEARVAEALVGLDAVAPIAAIADAAHEQLAADVITHVVESTSAKLVKSASGSVSTRVTSLAAQVAGIKVVDAASYEAAALGLRDIKAMRKEIERTFEPILRAQRAALDVTRDEVKRLDEPLANAEQTAKTNLVTWDDEQERLRLAAQRRIDEENALAAHEAKLEDAFAAEADGRTEDAEAILAAPTFVAPATVMRSTPAVSGISRTVVWFGEVSDLAALVRAAALELNGDTKRPMPHFALLNQPAVIKALSSQANSAAKKDKANCRLTGVRVWNSNGMRATASRA